MAQLIDSLPDTADAVLADARELRATADRAEVLLMQRACDWADLHPADEGEPGALDDPHLPSVDWRATAGLALAIGLSDDAGTRFLHQALELRHRLPRVWSRLLADELTAWRARRIADATMGRPDDVAEYVDRLVAPIAHKVGTVKLDRLLDEAMLRLYPEQREADQLDELDRRRVRLFDTISFSGVAHMQIDADLKDLVEFDAMVSLIAHALKELGCSESLDVRRAMAVGVLADPATAQAMLDGATAPTPRKQLMLHVHLSEAAIRGLDPVGRSETGRQPLLEQQIREWCGRADTYLTVLPVRDLNDHHATDAYEIPDRMKDCADDRDGSCVFPWCTRRARACDHDHVVAHGVGGSTCSCNIAPLCRRHHRLKTHTSWGYTVVEPGVYLWASPWGGSYLRDHTGTLDVTAPGRTRTDSGCRRAPPDAETRPRH